MQLEIMQWGPTWVRYQKETTAVMDKIDEIASVCATYGHVHRLWPQLISFLPSVGIGKIAAAKAQSPYPEDALLFKADEAGRKSKRLRYEFEPAAFNMVNTVLAEAIMLPEGQRSHIAHVN